MHDLVSNYARPRTLVVAPTLVTYGGDRRKALRSGGEGGADGFPFNPDTT